MITKETIVADGHSANCINSALVFYLCVVVKELAEPCHPGHYTRAICFGKLFSNQVAGDPPPLRSGAAFFAERKMVGVTGLEPVTLRLSSACSNQLSYTPRLRAVRSGAASPQIVERAGAYSRLVEP